ncbi:hypothetical protein FRX31_018893 [Thalictrum thalictroides]|uniref:Uncharacterized protein n=1 Tax=Thalictrum thalictroides TaxID=46969 RepID=A0A7J6W4T5_THATH|nr:hypothetical protein FRX31_018893 [Thalictrum thalictroides]
MADAEVSSRRGDCQPEISYLDLHRRPLQHHHLLTYPSTQKNPTQNFFVSPPQTQQQQSLLPFQLVTGSDERLGLKKELEGKGLISSPTIQ